MKPANASENANGAIFEEVASLADCFGHVRAENFQTPDFAVNSIKWELKSPMGSSARTIENNMRAARKQSENLVIDLCRIKIQQQRAIARINFFLSKPNQFKKVLVITKSRKVIEVL